MSEVIAGIRVPDSKLAREATDLVREHGTPLLLAHSLRVYLFGALQGRHRGWAIDHELFYVGAMFHDLGLTPSFRRTDQRFELDGADAARTFLLEHDYSHDDAQRVWLAVALHTTREIPERLEPELALVLAQPDLRLGLLTGVLCCVL